MSDKELLKTIQNDIKNIEKCIEECIDEDTIDYLEAIKQDMLIFKLEILKHITIDKMLRRNNMKEYTINVYNVNTLETIDTFVAEFENVGELCDFMDTQLHNYDVRYTNLSYRYTTLDYKMNNKNTPTHYQGTIQPIDLINAQDLNFNLGNVVKYVCRAGKKQGENVLSDLDKAKNYINYEIERIKKNE